jgi:esterase/lipase superfamily enzyme
MHRQYVRWYSPSLHRDMELLVFGHGGFPVLVFPTSYGRFYEYEDRGMPGAAAPKIERGELTLICVDSVDGESWYNRSAHPADRLHRQNAYDAYLALEIYPFARDWRGGDKWGPRAAASAGITPLTSRCVIRIW